MPGIAISNRQHRIRLCMVVLGAIALGAFLYSGVAHAGLPASQPGQLAGYAAPRSVQTLPPPQFRLRTGTSNLTPSRPTNPAVVLYDQYDNLSVSTVSSQNFEPGFDNYDAQAADDFVVPSGDVWLVDQVEVSGAYRGNGRTASVNVFFYASKGAVPGAPVMSDTMLLPSSGLDTGSFLIPLSHPLALPAGAYWVSVQANEDYAGGGQWFWRNRRDPVVNSFAAWRNPGGGFGRPSCTVQWGSRALICMISDEAPEQVFRLYGRANVSDTPTSTASLNTATSSSTATATSTSIATATLTGTPPTATLTGTVVTSTATATTAGSATGSALATSTVTLTARPSSSATAMGSRTVVPPPPPVITTLATIQPLPTSTVPACGTNWRVVNSPNMDSGLNYLYSVTVVSSDDVWAVGYYIYMTSSTTGEQRTLTEHWDGSAWSIVDSPDIGVGSVLNGVTATSTDDVWAVGYGYTAGQAMVVLILHWNGTEWSISPTADPPLDSTLADVTATSTTDAWAVGYYYSNSGYRTLALHWNGTEWGQVATPNSSGASLLSGVSATESSDVWAIGRVFGSGTSPLALHWDGQVWTTVPTPSLPDDGGFSDVWAISPTDIWAVGYFFYDFFDYKTLTEHWDGTEWSLVQSPFSGDDSELRGVSAVYTNDIWAVGVSETYDGSGSQSGALIIHWNGEQWSVVPNQASTLSSTLTGVSGKVSGDVWSVGFYSGLTLTEHYSDLCVTPSPTVTGTPPTRTPVPDPTDTRTRTSTSTRTVAITPTLARTATTSPTATQTAATVPSNTAQPIPSSIASSTASPVVSATTDATTTAQATACAIQFADVPSSGGGSTFYAYIRCLACRGIASGYRCGGAAEPCDQNHDAYYRPSAMVTRGQLSKITANAAGLSNAISDGRQSFHDVLPLLTDPFYVYIERLLQTGAITGYRCDTTDPQTGEFLPCDSQRRPWFRPGNQATRGEISKIAAIAAGFVDNIPRTRQTFADVPQSSPFWVYVESLASRHVIDGYNDAGHCGIATPCFRYNDNTTRGQMAKIAANTFFPDCRTVAEP